MACICNRRRLHSLYYERALSIWERVRADYEEDLSKDCELLILMITALFITVKFIGPIALMEYDMTLSKAAEDGWSNACSTDLMNRELRMCQLLDWHIFPDRPE
jgi:hypothetical protein